MKPTRPKLFGRTPKTPRLPSSSSRGELDSVCVYCRVRPSNESESCVSHTSETRIRLSGGGREQDFGFARVFGPDCDQKSVFDSVCLPLVKDLLESKNGLLFTYGVTGSGKTHTMQGSMSDGGLMYRAIDVLFNSIQESQLAPKYTFKTDKLNGFEINSSADAASDQHKDLISNMRKPKSFQSRKNTSDPDLSNRIVDETKVDIKDEDGFVYSLFISYCEFYNNYVYDLLDNDRDAVTGKRKAVVKNLREDSYKNIYVYGASEVEVRSPSEALEVYHRGQKRRRVEQTLLNHESSRSHSVFNIRLVKAQVDEYREVRLDQSYSVSQLALCDLAGSERTQRTGNTGDRLREAGNINSSLMTLRACIENLRDNQANGTNKPVPYRNAKITHIFRKYFEGTGKVRMIVCVNPRMDDYGENLNVMQFAEMAQEIEIEKVDNTARKLNFYGQTPGSKRGNEIFKDALRKIDKENIPLENEETPYSPVYSLGPSWPIHQVTQYDDEDVLSNIERHLKKRIANRGKLLEDQSRKHDQFRKRIVDMDHELILLREEKAKYRSAEELKNRRIEELEARLVSTEAANSSLQRRVGAYSETKNVLEWELDEKEILLDQQKKDVKRVVKKMSQQSVVNAELANKLKQNEANKKLRLRELVKFEAVKAIVNDKAAPPINQTVSDTDLSTFEKPASHRLKKADRSNPDIYSTPQLKRSALSSHHRRSRSVGPPLIRDKDIWVDHQELSATPNPGNALLQPNMKRRKSVNKLSEKDLMRDKASKYALTTHEADNRGAVETKVYKGDIIPTTGGGRQVVFNDVEVLTHEAPLRRSSRFKRSFEEFKGVGTRIAEMEERSKRNRH
eukprot:TRINITY_DN1469_c1_g1_i1.p1 TRINITY_DN1469_c1_g1~~TRINITY_DN1469_c1_g1_i1.p1  ORF type:complete len:848 (+),score=297.15 TRINITY_DN1469_c1_g1_i1:157-2700(+)